MGSTAAKSEKISCGHPAGSIPCCGPAASCSRSRILAVRPPPAAACVTHDDIQRLFRSIPGNFLVVGAKPPHSIIAASDDYLQLAQSDRSIVGQSLFDVFPDNPAMDRAGARSLAASLARVVETREPHQMAVLRYDVSSPQGGFDERYWLASNSPVLAANGDVEYIVHQAHDAGTAASRNAVEILESITEGFFTLDRSWRFDYLNAEAHRLLGVAPGALKGKVLWTTYPGLEGTEFERHYRRTMIEREKTSFTAFYTQKGRWYDVTCAPAHEGMSVFFRDSTAQNLTRMDSERVVLESEHQRRIYETAIDFTPDFVYVFGVDHRAMYANAALLKVWGVDDVRGKTWMDLGYEQWHADRHDREIEEVIATRAPIRSEIPFTGTNGRRYYDYIFAPVIGPRGEVVAVAGTTRDITERKQTEESIREQATRLAQADRAKDEFLATLSHELRNSLAPLRNSIQILKRTETANPPAVRVNEVMQRQVDQLVRLVDDLLEMSRITGGALSLRQKEVQLADVVRDAVDASSALLEKAGHALVVDLPETPVVLFGDEARLVQILGNLLNNAAKYTEDGGRIELRALREGARVAITVSDNGIGIAPDLLPRMFEMFSRGDRHSSRNQAGLGIGLALSRRLAEMHQGTLDARSDGLGRGSQFTLRLPLPQVQPTVTAATAGVVEARLDGLRVLVVDDNEDAGDSMAELLRLFGARVDVARSGAEAIERFPAVDPSVVLLDIGMPGINGYDVARAIRSQASGNEVLLIALTGWAQEEDRQRAIDAGIDHHVVKPASLEVLQSLLESARMPRPGARG
jgi:PAS domain S-box-containing protein